MGNKLSRQRSRGFVLLLLAVSALVLFGFVGLSVDVGYIHLARTRQQAAADAAAMAAVHEVTAGRSANVAAAARLASQQNGFTDGVNGVTVTVNKPPSSGDYSADNSATEVILAANASTFFMRTFGLTSVLVRTRAVSRPAPDPNCIYILDPADNDALKMGGTSAINASCGIYVNSTHEKAINVGSSACLNATSIKVVGGFYHNSSCPMTPTPTTGVDPVPDPLASLPAPAVGGCTQSKYEVDGVSVTASPGVYCEGITVKNGGRLTLLPGVYIISGKGLTMGGNTSRLTGSGVMIYNTSGNGYAFDRVDINAGTVQLSGPTSGPYSGILYFEDRAAPSGKDVTMDNLVNSYLEGAIYTKNNKFRLASLNSSAKFAIFVVKKLELTGPSVIGTDYSSLSDGSPLKSGAGVVE